MLRNPCLDRQLERRGKGKEERRRQRSYLPGGTLTKGTAPVGSLLGAKIVFLCLVWQLLWLWEPSSWHTWISNLQSSAQSRCWKRLLSWITSPSYSWIPLWKQKVVHSACCLPPASVCLWQLRVFPEGFRASLEVWPPCSICLPLAGLWKILIWQVHGHLGNSPFPKLCSNLSTVLGKDLGALHLSYSRFLLWREQIPWVFAYYSPCLLDIPSTCCSPAHIATINNSTEMNGHTEPSQFNITLDWKAPWPCSWA